MALHQSPYRMTKRPCFNYVFALLMLCMAAITAGCSSSSTTSAQSSPVAASLYSKVIQSGTIRCGYVVNTPGCMKDPNTGKLYGIGVDTLEMLAKNLNLKLQWTEEVGWGSMIEGLQANRYDIVASPVWTNANRARQADFSKPVYFSPIFAYVKHGDKRFTAQSLSGLDSPQYSIATIDGETAEIIAREDFPKARRVSLPQLSDVAQMLLSVSSKKADVAFAEPAVASGFEKNNPGAIQRVGDKPVRVFPNCWMFRRDQFEFKQMLDTALDQIINSGAVDKIIAKYEPAPHTLYRVALPYQSYSAEK